MVHFPIPCQLASAQKVDLGSLASKESLYPRVTGAKLTSGLLSVAVSDQQPLLLFYYQDKPIQYVTADNQELSIKYRRQYIDLEYGSSNSSTTRSTLSQIYREVPLLLVNDLEVANNEIQTFYVQSVSRRITHVNDHTLNVELNYEYGNRDSYYFTWKFAIDTDKLEVTEITVSERLEDRGG